MKKTILSMLFLIAVDQGIKLIIAGSFMDADAVIIQNFLRFKPVQNTYLSWINSMRGVTPPVYVMVISNLTAMAVTLICFRYLFFSYAGLGLHKLFTASFPIVVSGIVCAFIDVVYWGGSIDYICLFNWFTFDLKDCYMTVTMTAVLIIILIHTPRWYRLSKEERRRRGFISWARLGFPVSLPKDF
ncbi:MAG: signal peptidase II [Defluviitaleaceae bacterium]|nr:signal peptidase II [Defluviitaleaceae bacterium]MCL2835468.1 signal peptidase II [Defluviitaleaceae bacterium]